MILSKELIGLLGPHDLFLLVGVSSSKHPHRSSEGPAAEGDRRSREERRERPVVRTSALRLAERGMAGPGDGRAAVSAALPEPKESALYAFEVDPGAADARTLLGESAPRKGAAESHPLRPLGAAIAMLPGML